MTEIYSNLLGNRMIKEATGEGILNAQIEAVQPLAHSIERNGAKASCVIAFGSRATGSAKPESDLDTFFLIDFEVGNPYSLSDETLLRTKYQGQATTVKSGPAGDIHLFLYNQRGFEERLTAFPNLESSKLFMGLVHGVVVYGEEPLIEGKPLREYIKERLEN